MKRTPLLLKVQTIHVYLVPLILNFAFISLVPYLFVCVCT